LSRTARWLGLFLLLASVGLAAACGGGDDNGNGNGESTSTSAAGADAGDTPDAGSDGDDGGDDGDDGDDGEVTSGSEGDFREAAGRFPDATYRAEYELTGAEFGEITGGVMTFIKDGTDRLRIDFSGESEGEAFEVIIIESGPDTAFCLSGSASLTEVFGGSGQGVCFPQDPTGGFSSITQEFDVFDEDDFAAADFTEQQVAGQDAICATVTIDAEDSDTCFSDDGVLLSVESEGSGITATSVSGDVGDDDFALPYPVQPFPGIPE
jgi:hypothetical protein